MGRRKAAKTVRMTMGQAIVQYLSVQYSELDGNQQRLIQGMFGIFGHGNATGLGQGLREFGENLPYYQCRNEQSMVHTAAAFAKANRRLSALACTTSVGPGATNLLTGVATATINRLPVLLLPGDYYGSRHQGPVLQQLEHPMGGDVSVNDCFRPVSRFFDRILRPEQLLTALPEAMRVLMDPADTGAVTLALPQEIQCHAYDYPAHFFEERVWRLDRTPPNPQRIGETVDLLRKAKRPVVISGGGVMYSLASKELGRFCSAFGIPVAETHAGKGSAPDDVPVLLGGLGTNGTAPAFEIVNQADLVICVGTRLSDYTTGSQTVFQNPDVKFVSINVCGHDAYKQGALPIVADARESLKALTRAAKAAGLRRRASHTRQAREMVGAWNDQITAKVFHTPSGKTMGQGHAIGIINEQAKAGDTIIAAAGFPPGDLLKLWNPAGGRNCHIEFGNSCMGYELPAGLGVRMTQPNGEVFVFIGDGTFLLSPSELVTALQEDLKVTVVIMENHGFHSIRGLQMWRIGKMFGTEFRKRSERTDRLEGPVLDLDLAKIGEGMGARSWNVGTPDQLRKALAEARKERRSCVIVVEIDAMVRPPDSGMWWDFEVAEVSGDAAVRQRRVEYEQERKMQKFHY